ncbi:hypothetical protein OG259_09095 [Streptomyces sp. NBC_00250]|uniref:hypothetical protein n=1 Tax=Streptomyces sp. NBC_00250 TaxID=2903641 RepID=UPI002E290233|nr:hypothetical protein [Streptomyces sp. NBC_00250]
MAEKVFSIIEVAEQDGKWGYSDINFSEEETPDSPESDGGPVWRQVSPVAIAGSGLAALGSTEDDRRVFYQDLNRSLVGASYKPSLPDGRWDGYRVFTTEIGAPTADAGSALAVTGHVGGLGVYYFDDGRLDGGRRLVRLEERSREWTYDVSDDTPRGSSISPLSAVTTEQGEYVYYLDGLGHIVEASWLGTEGWSVDDLTSGIEACPTPAPLSRLTAGVCGTGSRCVYFLDESDRPVQLERTVIGGTKKRPESRVVWQVRSLSVYGAPAAAAGSRLAVLLTAEGHPQLYYLDTDRMVVGVGFNGRGWDVDRVGVNADDGAGTPPATAGSSLAAVARADRPGAQVYYLGTADYPGEGDNHLIELQGSGSGYTWTSRSLGAELDLPAVATGVPSPITAICTSGPRVYYTSEE